MKLIYSFDIDWTLADAEGVRDWHDPSKYLEDQPIKEIIKLAQSLALSGADIVYVTGRDEAHRDSTQRWLEHYELPRGEIYMWSVNHYDGKGDKHKASTLVRIREEAQYREDEAIRVIHFEDRLRCVRAIRDAGITVLHVSSGLNDQDKEY